MSRDEALSALFRAVAESETEGRSIHELFTFAHGFFLGKGLPKREAKDLAVDAVANGFWPQLDSLEMAAAAVV